MTVDVLKSSSRITVAALSVILLAGAVFLVSCQKGARESTTVTDVSQLMGGETRPTLSPEYFTGKVAKAYRIAKEIPQVLDSLYCYCDCKENFNHKSLLTCYVDEHASRCDICMDEAIMAYKLYKEGKDVLAIRKAVDSRFSR